MYNAIGNITQFNGVAYTYHPQKPHAVTQVGGTTYTYDANGNMTARGADAFTYDVENRLTQVTASGVTTQYAYNADDARVKRAAGGTTTYYIGNWFEVTQSGVVTKYYYFGGKRVAMRQGSTVTYLHGDHLGSTSVASNASGALVSRQTYFPYGAPRTSDGSLPTDYTYTGQKFDSASNLMYYNARYYDAALGRFVQPDTIIPRPYDPQMLNRYAYARNNPLKYIDPSGHDIIIVGGAGWSGTDPYEDPSSWEEWIRAYTGWTHEQFMEKWYKPWTSATGDEERMRIAQETGVAIFKWDAVPKQEQGLGNATEAAKYLQKQINDWGLKDVTIVGHSKGGAVLASLAELYQQKGLDPGLVKNLVLIDAPTGSGWDQIWGSNTNIDAAKAGVRVVNIPGLVQCGVIDCGGTIKNAITFPYAPNHDIRSELASQVFQSLNIYGDSHARSRWRDE